MKYCHLNIILEVNDAMMLDLSFCFIKTPVVLLLRLPPIIASHTWKLLENVLGRRIKRNTQEKY